MEYKPNQNRTHFDNRIWSSFIKINEGRSGSTIVNKTIAECAEAVAHSSLRMSASLDEAHVKA